MPAGEIPAVSAGEGTGSEAANWGALPVTVIDDCELWLFRPSMRKRLTDGALPGGFGDLISGPNQGCAEQQKKDGGTTPRLPHASLRRTKLSWLIPSWQVSIGVALCQ